MCWLHTRHTDRRGGESGQNTGCIRSAQHVSLFTWRWAGSGGAEPRRSRLFGGSPQARAPNWERNAGRSGWQLLHQGRKHNKKTVSNQRLVWNLWYRLCYPGYRLLDANIIRFNRNSDTTHQTLLRLCVRFIGAVSHSVTFIVQSVFVLDPHGARKREKTKDNT